MIVVLHRLSVPPDSGARVAVVFRERVAAIALPGVIGFALLRDRGEGEEREVVLPRWVDRAPFDRWAASNDVALAPAGAGSRSPVRATLELYDLLFERAYT